MDATLRPPWPPPSPLSPISQPILQPNLCITVLNQSISNPSSPQHLPLTPQALVPSLCWRDACFPTAAASSKGLSYFEPRVEEGRIIASCCRSEIDKGASFWADALFGFVVGLKPHIPTLKKLLLAKWTLKGSLEISSQAKALIFRFGDCSEKQQVLESGPWFVSGHLLILRTWRRKVGTLSNELNSIPIWIQVPDLPLEFWTRDSLSKIGSTIGLPLLADEHTVNRTRTSYARLCIEVSPLNPLPDEIWIDIEGVEGFKQRIDYEWRPKVCSHCHKFFHTEVNCELLKTSERGNSKRQAEKDSQNSKHKPFISAQEEQPLSKQIWREVRRRKNRPAGNQDCFGEEIPISVNQIKILPEASMAISDAPTQALMLVENNSNKNLQVFSLVSMTASHGPPEAPMAILDNPPEAPPVSLSLVENSSNEKLPELSPLTTLSRQGLPETERGHPDQLATNFLQIEQAIAPAPGRMQLDPGSFGMPDSLLLEPGSEKTVTDSSQFELGTADGVHDRADSFHIGAPDNTGAISWTSTDPSASQRAEMDTLGSQEMEMLSIL